MSSAEHDLVVGVFGLTIAGRAATHFTQGRPLDGSLED